MTDISNEKIVLAIAESYLQQPQAINLSNYSKIDADRCPASYIPCRARPLHSRN